MSAGEDPAAPVPIDVSVMPVWERFFTVLPLVLVATREGEAYDIAPKHMAMPLGWQNHYCFVCTPRHATYQNVRATGVFTVSFPRPEQVAQIAMAAAPRAEDAKAGLAALTTIPARVVDGVLVDGCLVHLECRLDRIVDGFGDASIITGAVVAASVDPAALRALERDDADLIHEAPLLAYLQPGRMASIDRSTSFPFPAGFTV
jgi:flavin reductase (DIM6/NTAB) family NADH-FMN oxidoreductase RutF